jgi:bifunctional non-homologous end joining protein LigD
MIEALIAGETNPAKLASLADRRVKASPEKLREALRGRVTKHHRFLLRLHLNQIDALHDLRKLPFLERKAALTRLLRDTEAGIMLNEHIAEDGPTAFAHACRLGAEGIVSKKVDGTYRSGPSRAWIKVRNPA